MDFYEPAEDSYFFVTFLEGYLKTLQKEQLKKITYCDMGTGTGILSETAGEYLDKKNIIAADINEKATDLVKKKDFKTVTSDLFENVEGSFDLITFNAPYLPFDSREPESSQVVTTGGTKGDEISIQFIQEARNHLQKEGTIFLLVSSLTPLETLKELGGTVVARKKIWMEELQLWKFR